MGMYTDCVLTFKTKPDTPEKVIEFLKLVVSRDLTNDNCEPTFVKPEDHPFFDCERASSIGSDACSRFIGDEKSDKDDADPSTYTEHDGVYTWRICSSIKNYGQPIQKFVQWVSQYIDEPIGTVIGWYEFEEFHRRGEVILGEEEIKYPPIDHDNGWY